MNTHDALIFMGFIMFVFCGIVGFIALVHLEDHDEKDITLDDHNI